MGIRITTWNVNGIRNPFGYQPWRDKRTFAAMFDLLEADIVVFQETKIQRKDLVDDMVLVDGWDNYWSLPKQKKGYSGVVIYTRNATCAPIRAEEGISGLLTAPNSSVSFRELPDDQQIGGYPSLEQISQSEIDPITLDSEGRCVILEFPAFVLIGTYCPAERDETRTSFRMSFLNMLDARIRNLCAMGKRVVWAGDLNISRAAIDAATAEEIMRRRGIDQAAWIGSPARRLFNQLLVGGQVHGERDEGKERPLMWDITRGFHEGRRGMYTCWETKVNARPGNYGARIDYVLCSQEMKDWFCQSDIQEGLMGSDHCPVYAVVKDRVEVEGDEKHILDIVNPAGMFENGQRKQEWSRQNLLPMSGKLIAQFDKRQNIRDMFKKRSNTEAVQEVKSSSRNSSTPVSTKRDLDSVLPRAKKSKPNAQESTPNAQESTPNAQESTPNAQESKPNAQESKPNAQKSKPNTQKSKPNAQAVTNSATTGRGQQSLKGFLTKSLSSAATAPPRPEPPMDPSPASAEAEGSIPSLSQISDHLPDQADIQSAHTATSTAISKNVWGQLFAKPIAPQCEHDERCKMMVTKKKGENCGRSFWMCARPLGPTGQKERGTQWRCQTFIWCSDWDARAKGGEG
ncbi:hypothetical protein DV735_g1006, partial [Chaetothyriales sp. CBS 134920]